MLPNFRMAGPCLTVALMLAGCGDRGGGASDGAIDLATLPELRAAEDRRIGSVESPDTGFSRVGGVQVAADGRVVVLEQRPPEIRVYDDAGSLLRAMGREGEGPGEFRYPFRLGFRHDTLWVIDAGLERLTLFDLDGAVLEIVPGAGVRMQVRDRSLRVVPSHPLGGGRFGSISWYPHPSGMAVDSLSVPAPAFDASGAVVDTVGTILLPPEPEGITVDNYGLSVPMALRDWPLFFAVGDDSVVVRRAAPQSPDPAVLTFTRRTAGGDTVHHRRLRYEPVAYELAHLAAATARAAFTDAVSEDAIAAALGEDGRPLPPFHAPVADHLVGGDGSIWLQREDTGGDALRWLVIDAEGTPRGHVRIPDEQQLMWVSADAAWVVEHDEFDVPWLVRLRLEG